MTYRLPCEAVVLKVVYFGNNKDYVETLYGHSELLAMVTRDDNQQSSPWVGEVKAYAAKHQIPCHTPVRLKGNQDFLLLIQAINPDLIVVGGYHLIIPRNIFSRPRYAAINVHPSLLPLYRGQHVINWAIINGERSTGVTIHYLEETLDTGPIIAQRAVDIEAHDTVVTLGQRLSELGSAMLKDVLQRIERGDVNAVPQEHQKSTYFHRRTPEQGRIDFSSSGDKIRNLVRALVRPYPGAFCYLKKKNGVQSNKEEKVIFHNCQIIRQEKLGDSGAGERLYEPGEVTSIDAEGINIHIRANTAIRVTDYEIEESPTITVEVGDRFR